MLPDDAVRLFLQGSWDRRQLDRFARPLCARTSGYFNTLDPNDVSRHAFNAAAY